jgi:hypothetical protein
LQEPVGVACRRRIPEVGKPQLRADIQDRDEPFIEESRLYSTGETNAG